MGYHERGNLPHVASGVLTRGGGGGGGGGVLSTLLYFSN